MSTVTNKSEYHRRWREQNRERIRKYQRKWKRQQRKDPAYRWWEKKKALERQKLDKKTVQLSELERKIYLLKQQGLTSAIVAKRLNEPLEVINKHWCISSSQYEIHAISNKKEKSKSED